MDVTAPPDEGDLDFLADPKEMVEARRKLLGPPALMPGENDKLYDKLFTRLAATVKPADFLEEIWVRDIVDLVWEAYRLRRLKAAYLTSEAHMGILLTIKDKVGVPKTRELADQWARRNPVAIKEVQKVLEDISMGGTADTHIARSLANKLDTIERIDRMTMNAESRRNVTLREIDRHRAAVAAALRRAAEDVEEAEFDELD